MRQTSRAVSAHRSEAFYRPCPHSMLSPRVYRRTMCASHHGLYFSLVGTPWSLFLARDRRLAAPAAAQRPPAPASDAAAFARRLVRSNESVRLVVPECGPEGGVGLRAARPADRQGCRRSRRSAPSPPPPLRLASASAFYRRLSARYYTVLFPLFTGGATSRWTMRMASPSRDFARTPI